MKYLHSLNEHINDNLINEGLFGNLMDKLVMKISKKIGAVKFIDQELQKYKLTIQQLIVKKKYQSVDINYSDKDNQQKSNDMSKEQEIATKKLDLNIKKIIKQANVKTRELLQDYYDLQILEVESEILDFRNKKGYLTEEEKANYKEKKKEYEKSIKEKGKEVSQDAQKLSKNGSKESEGTLILKTGQKYVYTSPKDQNKKSEVVLLSDKPDDKGLFNVKSTESGNSWKAPEKSLSMVQGKQNNGIELKKGEYYVYTSTKDENVKTKVMLLDETPNEKGEYLIQSSETMKKWYGSLTNLVPFKS